MKAVERGTGAVLAEADTFQDLMDMLNVFSDWSYYYRGHGVLIGYDRSGKEIKKSIAEIKL